LYIDDGLCGGQQMLYVVASKQERPRSQTELFDAVYCPAEYFALWLPSEKKKKKRENKEKGRRMKKNLLAGSSCLLQVIEMLVIQCVRC
jgi:hypothetical protein